MKLIFVLQNNQTPLNIAHKLGYISVLEALKNVTDSKTSIMQTSQSDSEKYRVIAPEAMHETFMSDSEEEGICNNYFYKLLYSCFQIRKITTLNIVFTN